MASTAATIPLCVPSLDASDAERLQACFASTFVSSVGPFVDEFEERFAARVGMPHAIACTSGTAAIHLALVAAGIQPGDRVLCSDFTFVASANPIHHCGAEAVFVDSERGSWNLDPALVDAELSRGRDEGRPYAAVLAVHIYGQPAAIGAIADSCTRHHAVLIEDAAESLGAYYASDHPDPRCADRHVGTVGDVGCFSFNGNKIITAGGGGMVVCRDPQRAALIKHLSTQAKQPGVGFVHDRRGFNYRMPNLNASLGLSQLDRLDAFLTRKRAIRAHYQNCADRLGWQLQPQAPATSTSAWMPCMHIGADRDRVQAALQQQGIISRPGWLPMARQPAWAGSHRIGGSVADELGEQTLCLPCSIDLTDEDMDRITTALMDCAGGPP